MVLGQLTVFFPFAITVVGPLDSTPIPPSVRVARPSLFTTRKLTLWNSSSLVPWHLDTIRSGHQHHGRRGSDCCRCELVCCSGQPLRTPP